MNNTDKHNTQNDKQFEFDFSMCHGQYFCC